jgi:hypothetical protein
VLLPAGPERPGQAHHAAPGHGMAVRGSNYLIPVASDNAGEDEVEIQGPSLQSVLNKMEAAKNRLNLVVLDACRNNPFGRGFRSGTRGRLGWMYMSGIGTPINDAKAVDYFRMSADYQDRPSPGSSPGAEGRNRLGGCAHAASLATAKSDSSGCGDSSPRSTNSLNIMVPVGSIQASRPPFSPISIFVRITMTIIPFWLICSKMP